MMINFSIPLQISNHCTHGLPKAPIKDLKCKRKVESKSWDLGLNNVK